MVSLNTAKFLLKGIGFTSTVHYAYNGLGDRLRSTVSGPSTTTYVMDFNARYTQVLDDGTYTYLYGNSRLAQIDSTTEYFLDDALGSVRQMGSTNGSVTLARSYDPYGAVRSNAQLLAGTSYGFTGEYTETTAMLYLRARHYAPSLGRFMTRDTWPGSEMMPMSYNRWAYVLNNPLRYTDPTGHCIRGGYWIDDNSLACGGSGRPPALIPPTNNSECTTKECYYRKYGTGYQYRLGDFTWNNFLLYSPYASAGGNYGNDFERQFVLPKSLPSGFKLDSDATMNCFEVLFYLSWESGELTHYQIRDLYNVSPGGLMNPGNIIMDDLLV